jgi:CubicO group peptidase (beta-lactamase class C family)
LWALLLGPAGLSGQVTAGPTNRIAGALQPFVDSRTLAGAVTLVANPNQVLSLEAVGYADVARRTPMKTDALFWIASMSKAMTAAALMMLVDEGKVNLGDPVEKYLPEFRGQWLAAEQDDQRQLLCRPARPITVEDVLSHTSGLPFMSRAEHHIDDFSLSAATLTYALSALKFEPGTKYDYSNAGINTAGRIIEVVSGLPYETFMDQRLFQPLGMKDTTFWPNQSQLKRLAKSYKPNSAKDGLEETAISQLTYPLESRKRGPSPAGGYFSTARDLARFCQMVLNGGTLEAKRYLSEAAIKTMTTSHTRELLGRNGDGYGLGWSVGGRAPGAANLDRAGTFGHGGAYSTDMQIDAEHQLIMIFLVQHAGYPGTEGGQILPRFRKAAREFPGTTQTPR